MKAWTLAFGDRPDELYEHPPVPGRRRTLIPPGTDPVRAGWSGGLAPGFGTAAWPRSPITGFPMMHGLTIRLPTEYQRRGPELPAISFFVGEGQFAEAKKIVAKVLKGKPLPQDKATPFLRDVAEAAAHRNPNALIRRDIIDGAFALVWLTEEQFSSRSEPPADTRDDDQRELDDEGANAWDHVFSECPIWLVERDDPNAGKVPSEENGTPYESHWLKGDDGSYDYQPWARPLMDPPTCHLGGTTFYIQSLPEGLTPWYLELEELPGMNFGGGNCQIDLESDTFDWACG